MYETEANAGIELLSQLPPTVVSAFAALKGQILARTVLPWSEHCTECVWPTCYSTCDLYAPREDRRCRRFVDGMVRIESPTAVNSYLLKIQFKRWAKLWTPGNIRLCDIGKAQKLEKRDYVLGTALYQLPLPATVKRRLTEKRYSFKKRMAQRSKPATTLPTSFLLECYNPGDRTIPLSVAARALDGDSKVPFEHLIELTPGFHRLRIPFEQMHGVIDCRCPFHIELVPSDAMQEVVLYFGMMDFVRERSVERTKSSKVKCVVWDLDNTLWEGTLAEVGREKLRLRPNISQVIEELDHRGILHSIASKNDPAEVLEVLRFFHLEDYFLCSQISWSPKSEAIKAIAHQLNIGIDSMLFIDDSEFELDEVKASCPDVQVLGAAHYLEVLELDGCRSPVTEESKTRRKMYQLETRRQRVAQTFGQDYKDFLTHCNIRVNIRRMTEENLERVHELTQRTNQMNFSGNRYDRDVLKRIMATPYLDTYVLECQDRFGSYGVIGFSVVDSREPRMTDVMFSCRIQAKRVEHAFLGYIIGRYRQMLGKDFHADYRRTPRNAASGRVFEDLGMKEEGCYEGVLSLVFEKNKQIPEEGIIQVVSDRDPVIAV